MIEILGVNDEGLICSDVFLPPDKRKKYRRRFYKIIIEGKEKKCRQCGRVLLIEKFIGINGRECKLCSSCREYFNMWRKKHSQVKEGVETE